MGVPPHEIDGWPARDLADLMQYDQIQPFGDERANWHAAIIAQLLAAIHTPKERRAPGIADFMYRDIREKVAEEEEQTLAFFRAMKGKKRGKSR